MATYLSLFHFTDEGARKFQASPDRAASFQAAAKKSGVEVKNIFWTLGDYDGAIVFEAADDETATGVMLGLAALGNIRTKTLRAFTPAEMQKIIAKASKA
jgi:uncharacterized protein with GYD domain